MLFSPQYGWWHTCCCASRWHCKSRTLASEDWGGPARRTTRTPAPPQQLIYTEARRAATAESSAAHPGWGSSPASYWRPVLCTQVTSRGASATNSPLSGLHTKSIIRVWRHLFMWISFRVKGNSRLFIITGVSCGNSHCSLCYSVFLQMFAHILFLKILLWDLD